MKRFWGVYLAPDTPSGTAGSGTPSSSGSEFTGEDIAAAAEPAAAEPAAPAIDPTEYASLKTKAEKLAWAEAYADPKEVEQSVALRKWFADDPEAAYEFVTGHMRRAGLIKEPTASAPVRQPAAFTDPQTGEPQPDMQIKETGELFFSAEQNKKHAAWHAAELKKEIAPLQKFQQAEEERRKSEAERAEANRQATAIIETAWAKWPHFQDYKDEINAAVQKGMGLEQAYIEIVTPNLQRKEREKAVADMRFKGKASTHNPAGSGAGATTDKSKLPIKELMRLEMEKRRLA